MVKRTKPRRVTFQDKWVIGGDGTFRDLMVVSPVTKLTIDLVANICHPTQHYLLKKVLLTITITLTTLASTQSFITTAITTITTIIIILALTKAYRYVKTSYNNYRYTHQHAANEPFVPLDRTGDPHSAILLTRHVLIGGDSGSGKSNAVWMILQGLSNFNIPFRAHVIDPAGGVEMNDLQDSPYTLSYVDRPTDADSLIINFRDRMNTRLQIMKKHHIRQFDPTQPLPPQEDDNNWHYLIIDELLLCAAQIKQGPLSPLGDILAVGRKAGFIVIACTQLGQKSTLGDFRDLFPQRIAFSTRTHEMTDAILGTAASQEAPAHLIRQVGEGFLYNEKHRGYYNFYTRHITDTQSISNPKDFLKREAERIAKQSS